MRITLLGTGTSHGVPTLDCMITDYASCPVKVCRKAIDNPRHRRTRASILVQANGTDILIDTSQDFRQQMLANRVTRLDAVLFTHGHADHIYGLPDIRSYCRRQDGFIPIYGSEETLAMLDHAFDYVFHPPEYVGGGIPSLMPHLLNDRCQMNGLTIEALPVVHGPLLGCQGYRFGKVAYIPDVKRIPPESLARLRDLDLLILNCLRLRPHEGHLSLEESLDYAHQIAPRRCLFTHLAHDIDYETEAEQLPDWIDFAYDGQTVEVP
jgi:phosphoribosyl 1,2-cyclic phosphate phosphodiesterase